MIQPARMVSLISCFGFIALIGLTACSNTSQNPDAEKLTNSADQMRSSGNDAGAADLYQSALLVDAKDVHARKSLGEILEAHGDNRNAEIQYREALVSAPSDIDLKREHARVLVKLQRPAEARDEYEAILNDHPSDAKTLNGLGIALDYLDQHVAAQQAYRTALDNNPHDLSIINNLAHSYVLTGAYLQAIALLEPHANDPEATPALRQNLAEAYALQGMDADAERMALKDLPMDKAKRNLTYYRAERIKLGLVPKFFGDLGHYPTRALADAHASQIKADFPNEVAGLNLITALSVDTIGGTPSFTLHVTGFHTIDKLRSFCNNLKNNSMSCQVVSVQ